MSKEELKQRILNEMCVDDEEWRLTKEIYEENKSSLKEGIGLSNIYNRIQELKGRVWNGKKWVRSD